MDITEFPRDWSTALVLVAHPDDPEYGMAAAVASWTAAGKVITYALATSGEAGIAGMPPEQAGPLREDEQRASAAVVGVDEVEFWGFTDSELFNTPELRAKIAETITRVSPDIVLSLYGGAEWAPGAPNQRDHMEFAAAVAQAYDELPDPPRALFTNGPGSTHAVDVDGFVETAVASLAEHEMYLSVLDPDTPVVDQARAQVEMTTGPIDGFPAAHASGFTQLRPTG
ncbi:PIG-L family deacetylase [Gordonia sp. (in: high G+C Gram-positive bacteria)]|uniref:PIG-L deacetylase family protein n=1 Tax=Gordonia sp. (in: high G+C Gram-positive bacteria) TaxID=84139 RepID=UPI0026334242|nr:PIG-L family deacetylase [Gordonia sp. (in: high G+C Gram-positive bacteria)]